MFVARAVAAEVGTVPSLIITRHAVKWTASIGDGVDVTVCLIVSFHLGLAGRSDIAEGAVVGLACDDLVVFWR